MKNFFATICCAFLLLSCKGQTAGGVEKIAPAQFSQKLKSENAPQLLDVRTPGEYAGEHIDNAINVNWNGPNFETEVAKLDKSKPVFVYCKIGGRSSQAAAKLSQMGFSKVYDLEGGILKWTAEGYAPKTDRIIGMCSQEYNELLNTDKLVLVDFYAKWCAPCKKMAPYLEKMTDEMKDKVTIVRLDADEHKTLVEEMKIAELPALFLYKDKKIIWQHKGFISEAELKQQLQ
ncbi:Thiosulfate sulfurtransferase GlpE [Flavobacterium longum]|uniref:thioredoxin domain-containing protein n=1 Tax=Flavobacterium longum TaxID=1299340 RepID=UPI0039E8D304